MKAAQLLDEAKTRLCLKSDYALAKASGMRREDLPSIRSGKRAIPLHLAYWLAITLERDPASVVAELEEEREKNETRKAFWRSFLSRAAVLTTAACTLVSLNFVTGGTARGSNGGDNARSDNPYYVK